MSESPSCFNARVILKEISLSRNIFLKAYDDCMSSESEQSRDQARALKNELEEKIHALQEAIFSAKMERAIEVLGRENVHGLEDVALLLGFVPKDVPPIPYTAADFEKCKVIKEKGDVEEMLVLFVNDRDGNPLTGEALNVLVQKKYTEMDAGNFLYNVTWYKDEEFYKKLGLKMEWKLITKSCLPDSYGKRHHFEKGDGYKHEDTQEYAIEQFADKVGSPRESFNRPEPFAMMYVLALHFVATDIVKGRGNGEHLLELKYHWSDVQASDGRLVYVGLAGRDGVGVYGHSRDYRGTACGVCLSR